MKNKSYFFVLFSFCAISCNTNEIFDNENVKSIDTVQEDNQISTFFFAVDSLNNSYAQYKTRGLGKWGGKFLSAVVDYTVGAVAGAATSPVGGAVIGTAASWAYDEYLDKITKEGKYQDSKQNNTLFDAPNIVLKPVEPSFIDSVGFYHNKLLCKLSNSGKSYINEQNELLTKNIISDVVNHFNSIQNNKFTLSQNEMSKYSSLIDDFIKEMYPFDEECINRAFTVFEKKCNTLGLSSKTLENIKVLSNKLANNILYMDEIQATKYAEDLYKLIDASQLKVIDKESLKMLDNISINSKLYWDLANNGNIVTPPIEVKR